jgi:hypothetical protein
VDPAQRKPGWPLIVLAVLSFVPGLGVCFGSAAVTWGLLTERPRARLAIGIGAAGALLQILAFVVFFGASNQSSPLFRQAFTEMARQDLAEVVAALEAFRERESAYPPSLVELQRKLGFKRAVSILDQSAGLSLRPRLYQYRLAADGASYDLFAVGPDGEPDTADDIRPVLPDSLRARSGLRPSP